MPGDVEDDPRRQLVRRVAESAAFQHAWRAREMLVFICEWALRTPERPPREQDIAVAVFGRDDFDSSIDPLVRVQASTMRVKLYQYFAEEGAGEPTIIDVPKGGYAAVFRPRSTLDDQDDSAPEVAPAPTTVRRTPPALAAACLVLAALCALLFAQLRAARRPSGKLTPGLESLWRPLAANGRPTVLVLGDSGLAFFLETTHRWLSAAEYQRWQFRDKPPPEQQGASLALAQRVLDQPSTDIGDARLAHRYGLIVNALGGTGEVVYAREVTADAFKGGNLILSGPRRANPWVEPFEDEVAFRALFDKGTNSAYFDNRAPQAGEPGRFGHSVEHGHCRVAFLAKADGTSRVLMLTGTDVAATRAGTQLVLDEAALLDLGRALGVPTGGALPPFELMLRVAAGVDGPGAAERVALRMR
jgi:hypothetical protein